MVSNFQLLLLLTLAFSIFHFFSDASAVISRRQLLLGGYLLIKDPNVSQVQIIGKFAVDEHNKEAKTNLTYLKVVKGEKQVVDGINYRLIVEAKHGNNVLQHYEAVVYIKAGTDSMKLLSFGSIEELF